MMASAILPLELDGVGFEAAGKPLLRHLNLRLEAFDGVRVLRVQHYLPASGCLNEDLNVPAAAGLRTVQKPRMNT